MVNLTLFLSFFKIGFFNFGGGLAMLPLIFQEIQINNWMTASEFADLIAISQVTPGPVAVNSATYIGNSLTGLFGAAVATIGVTLPSFLVMMVVMRGMDKFRETKWLKAVFAGIRPATIGLLASALFFIGKGVYGQIISESFLYLSVVFFALVLFLKGKFKLSPISLTLLSALAGAGIYGLAFA